MYDKLEPLARNQQNRSFVCRKKRPLQKSFKNKGKLNMKYKNNGSKIAHRDAILGTFVRTVIPDGADALIRFTGRGVIIEKNPEGRRGFHLKWVDARSKKGRNEVYRVQLQSEDVHALQTDEYDHLL